MLDKSLFAELINVRRSFYTHHFAKIKKIQILKDYFFSKLQKTSSIGGSAPGPTKGGFKWYIVPGPWRPPEDRKSTRVMCSLKLVN